MRASPPATIFHGAPDFSLTPRLQPGETRAGIVTNRFNGLPFRSEADVHKGFGNVALADGSVQGLSTMGLRQALKYTGVATNCLAMP